MNIGIYGGTFNPIHYGHLRTAVEVAERLSLEKIIFIPAGKPPFEKQGLAGAGHRYNMVRAAIAGNGHFEISRMEISTRGKSYSVDTVARLRNRYRKCVLFFILGIDAFLDLPGWKEPERLVSLTNMVIISRPGYAFADLSASPFLKGVRKRTLLDLDRGRIDGFSFDISEERKCYLSRVTGLNISASHIRNLTAAGRDIKYLLPDSVKSYIISNKLYTENHKTGKERFL